MMTTFLIILVLLVIFWLAVKARAGNNRYRAEQATIIESPMAEAIAQIVGIAGGIYLSLVMTVSFLGIALPERMLLFSFWVDPLAAVSIVLALLQPIGLYLLRRLLG